MKKICFLKIESVWKHSLEARRKLDPAETGPVASSPPDLLIPPALFRRLLYLYVVFVFSFVFVYSSHHTYITYLSTHLSMYINLVILISRICLCISISSYSYHVYVYTFVSVYYIVTLISHICLHICLCIFISSYLYRIFVYTFVFCIWVILRCWGKSSMVCQQKSDAL